MNIFKTTALVAAVSACTTLSSQAEILPYFGGGVTAFDDDGSYLANVQGGIEWVTQDSFRHIFFFEYAQGDYSQGTKVALTDGIDTFRGEVDTELNLFSINYKGITPISDKFDFYFTIGVGYGEADEFATNIISDTTGLRSSDSALDGYEEVFYQAGIGVSYAVSDNFNVNLGLKYFQIKGDSNGAFVDGSTGDVDLNDVGIEAGFSLTF